MNCGSLGDNRFTLALLLKHYYTLTFVILVKTITYAYARTYMKLITAENSSVCTYVAENRTPTRTYTHKFKQI